MENYSKYKGKGLSGLQNLGNTCFINSTIQCMFNVYELNDTIDKINLAEVINDKPDSVLLLEWNKLREMIWNENCVISPGGFVSNVKKISKIKDKDLFTGCAQNDLPEFLFFLLDCFHNALCREVNMTINGNVENDKDKMAKICYEMMQKMYKKEFSEILTLFYGIHVSNIISLENNILSSCPEPFLNISLPIPNKKNINLYHCFDLYTESEELKGENAWLNEKTNKKEDVTKKLSFWSLPTIMIIDLKRFTQSLNKNNATIDIPLNNLDMRKYVNEYNPESYVYELFGVCNHFGDVNNGHYTSFIRNANDNWYHYDDINVDQVKNPNLIIGSNAYCLFFRKKK
tara:strand:- start:676 stop:1707 length:1032 start_codon:yes stop_codon:yes gene_type:complete